MIEANRNRRREKGPKIEGDKIKRREKELRIKIETDLNGPGLRQTERECQ